MDVSVDEPGREQTARAIDDVFTSVIEPPADFDDPVPISPHIERSTISVAVEDSSACEEHQTSYYPINMALTDYESKPSPNLSKALSQRLRWPS